jgi:hypothetical protein
VIKPKALTFVIAGVVVLAGALAVKRAHHHTPKQSATESLDSSESERSPASVPTSALLTVKPTVASKLTATQEAAKGSAPVGGASLGSKVPSRNAVNWTYSRELSEYSLLKKKVFTTSEEKAQRTRLLQDRNVVQSMLEYLAAPAAAGSEAAAIQNDAIDLLVEARAAGSDAAADVMSSVLRDGTIENANLDMETRTSLAGVKAEVLYRWSAQEPGRAGQMASLLPGPVSRNIWNNVKAAQAQNLLDSQQELSTHH